MADALQTLGGVLGFVAGLAQASQQARQRRRQENIALLQLLGQQPGRTIDVAQPGTVTPTSALARFRGAGPLTSTTGAPVVMIGNTPITVGTVPSVAEQGGLQAILQQAGILPPSTAVSPASVPSTPTPTPQPATGVVTNAEILADPVMQALAAQPASPDRRLRMAQRKQEMIEEKQRRTTQEATTQRAEEGLQLRREAAERAQTREQRQAGRVTKQDLALIASGTPRPGINITPGQAKAALDLQQTDGTDIQFNDKGQLVRVTVGGQTQRVPVDKVVARQQGDRLDAIQEARGLAQQLRSLLRPENVGLLGQIRGTIQDMIQTGGAVGGLGTSLLQGAQQAIARDVNAGLTDANVSELFDPSIAAIDFLENTLAYAVARSNERQGRLNRDDVLNAKRSLGIQGIFANPARIQASLQQLGFTLNMRERIVRERLGIPQKTFQQRDRELQDAGVTDRAERLRRIIEDRDRGIVKPWPTGQQGQ